jgi:hypothetical protein
VNRGNLNRLYDRLTIEERFQLAIAATGRGDNDEHERLLRSCPKRVYQQTDAELLNRFTDTERIIVAALFELLPIVRERELLSRLRSLVETYAHAAVDASAEAAYRMVPGCDDAMLEAIFDSGTAQIERLAEAIKRIDASYEAEAASIVHALDGFAADELHVELSDLIATYAAPLAPAITELRQSTPIAERVATHQETFVAAWRWYRGTGPEPTFENEGSSA